jgi:hypothetical protein
MRFEQLVHRVESRLLALLPDEAREEQADEASLLKAEIARQQAELSRATARRGEAAERLEKNATQAALLPSQVESSLRRGKASQAMRQALELERLRKELEEDRAELPRLEQLIWSLGFRLRQLRRELGRLQAPDRR